MRSFNVKFEFQDPQARLWWISTMQTQQSIANELYKELFSKKINNKIAHDAAKKLFKVYPEFNSQMLGETTKEVISTFKTIKANKHRLTEAPTKKNFSVRMDKNLCKLPNVEGSKLTWKKYSSWTPVKFQMYTRLKEAFENPKMKVKNGAIVFYKNDQFWMSIPFEEEALPQENNDVLGVDLGVRRLWTDSNGRILLGHEFQRHKRKIRHLKDVLKSKSAKGSQSAKRHLKKVRTKERNFSKNYVHLAVNELLRCEESIIVLENLKGIKKNQKRNEQRKTVKHSKGHNRRLSQIPWFEFRSVLTYKAPLRGKRVETVDPRMTSKTNSVTGLVDGERRGCRYTTPIGWVLDADWNAARNIGGFRGEHPVPLHGNVRPTGRLLSTNRTTRNSLDNISRQSQDSTL